jgi:hypothetical protein
MFAVDDENVKTMYDWIKENIGYDKMCVGAHVNANRPHTHFGITNVEILNVKDQRKAYNRKGLNKVHPDIKLSMHKNPDEEDDKKCLGYPLKEYAENKDIKYREYINIDDEELEGLRVFAHNVYRAAKYTQNKKEERKQQGGDRIRNLEKYINKKIETEMMDEDPNFGKKLKQEYLECNKCYIKIFKMVCDYNLIEEEKITWRWNDIATYTYSKMYRMADEDHKMKVIMFQQKIKYKE